MTQHDNLRQSDLKIIGDGGSNGGVFNKVNIVGDAEINGDTDCLTFKCTGNVKIDGSLQCDLLKATGDVTTKGSLLGGEIRITGNLNVGGGLKATRTQLNGDISIEEDISGEDIGIHGNCYVKTSCQVEHIHLKGAVQVEGMLNAEIVELKLLGESRAAEIVGSNIRIEPHSSLKWISLIKPWGNPQITADVIEGDTLWLEHTVADIVRGGNVTIGPGCRIRLVEYSDVFRQNGQSDIAETRHIVRTSI